MTFLGTGTSQGVPIIGCDCPVCRSGDLRNHRLRTSACIQVGGKTIVIDCGPDFRQQMLRNDIRQVDAILLTHEHNDHIIGLDDVRPFNFQSKRDMNLYATERVAAEVQQRFAYAFSAVRYPGAPALQFVTIDKDHPFEVEGIPVQPIEVMHGTLPVLGFRFGDFTYLTDIKTISAAEIEKVRGTKVLALGVLHHTPHYSHLCVDEAIALIDVIKPEQTYFIHVSHHMGLYDEVSAQLPEGIALAYDGLKVAVSSA
ncbi:MAG: MBL fold metallo-hydrolase [Saprospiraceae bacterium]|nr:MBL fold metallo-hydrolase [Saprospiraceae bacterium]